MNGLLFPFGDPQGAPQLEPMRNAMERNSAAYWRAQSGLIAAMQDYANGWFARRHDGAQAALEATRRMCLARDPAEAAREMHDFWRGAMDRLAADALALQRQAAEVATEVATKAAAEVVAEAAAESSGGAARAAAAAAAQGADGRARHNAQAHSARPQA